MRLRSVRRMAWLGVAIVGALTAATGGGWLVTDGPLAPAIVTGPASLAIGGPFRLTDHRGQAVSEADFRGQPMAVFFGFTHCPDICPTALGDMTALIERLGSRADEIAWLFISVDPARDTPEELTRYLDAFDPRIRGLTGTEAQVAEAAQSFRIAYRRIPQDGGTYTMDHSSSIFLLDRSGRFAGSLDRHENDAIRLAKLLPLLPQ